MDMSAPQCSSSGCESGWTLYLDQSSNQYQGFGGFVDGNYARVEGEEEEDLSMVSDASSGPPHYCEDDDHEECCFDQLANNKKNKSKKKKNKEFSIARSCQQHSFLDDTASSPALGKKVSKNVIEGSKEHALEFSQGFSATHFKGKSSLKKHFGGLFHSSLAEKSSSQESGGLQGRKWK
ncbi:hypothetical protein JCGZ_16010 [Jatropha curcas]|uniref:Uncharacterized protein n=1 Tax=Jatropha curcas TaxID=180498 RepID=A0A067L2Z7_JATCU|nr:hypothetical protein JCGZ_16010 [Jatropha curcas]